MAAGMIAGVVIVATTLLLTASANGRSLLQTETVQALLPMAENAGASLISYQGRLLDPATGQPKPDGSYPMTFRIYNSSDTVLWSEAKSVSTNRGLFTTLLGDTTALPIAVFNGQDLFLGVTVSGDPETTPRQRIAHVAYAVFAQSAAGAGDADRLDGLDSTSFAATVHNHDSQYYGKAEGDNRFVNSAGPDSITGSNAAALLEVRQNGAGTGVSVKASQDHGLISENQATAPGKAGVAGVNAPASGTTINSSSGVLGDSRSGRGVVGVSLDNDGVLGFSTNKYGVSAQSLNQYGLWAYSQNNYAIYAAGSIAGDKVVYRTPRQHYFSVAGDIFRPRTNAGVTYYSGYGNGGAYISAGTETMMLAPVTLPDGAVVTEFLVNFYDGSVGQDLTAILRNQYSSGYSAAIASVSTSGSAGVIARSTTLNHTVDNRNAYLAAVSCSSSGCWSAEGPNLAIRSVIITYQLTEAQ
jgi:hypothetical protein